MHVHVLEFLLAACSLVVRNRKMQQMVSVTLHFRRSGRCRIMKQFHQPSSSLAIQQVLASQPQCFDPQQVARLLSFEGCTWRHASHCSRPFDNAPRPSGSPPPKPLAKCPHAHARVVTDSSSHRFTIRIRRLVTWCCVMRIVDGDRVAMHTRSLLRFTSAWRVSKFNGNVYGAAIRSVCRLGVLVGWKE